jgi:hypothetical protein
VADFRQLGKEIRPRSDRGFGDSVLDALDESARCVAGHVDPLCAIRE